MTRFVIEETIAAPIDETFAASTDFEGAPRIISGIERVEMLTDGPVGPGTRFRETRTMFGREATEEMEVADFEPPQRYTLKAESHGARYLSELSFAEVEGGTRVKLTFAAQPLTFMAKVMSILTKPLMKTMVKACAQDLADLKKALES